MERRNLLYGTILGVLGVAIVVVVVLILRKQSMLPFTSSVGSGQQQNVKTPTPSKPIESYTPEPAWKEGDPPIPVDESSLGGSDTLEPTQP